MVGASHTSPDPVLAVDDHHRYPGNAVGAALGLSLHDPTSHKEGVIRFAEFFRRYARVVLEQCGHDVFVAKVFRLRVNGREEGFVHLLGDAQYFSGIKRLSHQRPVR